MYSWLVFVHLVGLVIFSIAHGASVFVAFRLRASRDPAVIAVQLQTSQMAIGPMYIGLLLLGIGGLGAAWNAGLLLAPWVVGSYVVIVVIIGAMYGIATRHYAALRELVGSGSAAVDAAALDRALVGRQPEMLATVGVIGLLLLVWLMVLKPG